MQNDVWNLQEVSKETDWEAFASQEVFLFLYFSVSYTPIFALSSSMIGDMPLTMMN